MVANGARVRFVFHIAVLVNPTAGKGRAGNLAPGAIATLRLRQLHVTEIVGHDAIDAQKRLQEAVSTGIDAVVAIGGDGTVSLALQVVAGTDVPLGVIALGTGDDVARQHGLPRGDHIAAAHVIADALAQGRRRLVDVGLVRHGVGETRWFLTVMTSGFDSEVNEKANELRWPTGNARYIVAMLRILRRFKAERFTLRVDAGAAEHEAMLVAVGNGNSYGGGMLVCPAAVTDDGLLTLTIVKRLSRSRFLALFPRVYRGTHVHHRAVEVIESQTVSLDAMNRTAWADGERIGPLPVQVECVRGGINLLA
jgi:diacylglycerol kinase (ATP)